MCQQVHPFFFVRRPPFNLKRGRGDVDFFLKYIIPVRHCLKEIIYVKNCSI